MTLFVHEVRNQQLLFWRSKEAAVFIFVFPPLLFLLLSGVLERFPGRGTFVASPRGLVKSAPPVLSGMVQSERTCKSSLPALSR